MIQKVLGMQETFLHQIQELIWFTMLLHPKVLPFILPRMDGVGVERL